MFKNQREFYEIPADSKALQVTAERPVSLLVLAGHKDALDEGQQLGGQQGVGSRHVAQNPNAMTGVPLRDEQHRPGETRAAVCLNLEGNLGKEIRDITESLHT